MITHNDIEYGGVWELDGKFYTLSGACVTDWVLKQGGAELYNEEGDGYVEVEYIKPEDPEPWKNIKQYTLKEARAICRELSKRDDTHSIRAINFDSDENGVFSIIGIVEVPVEHVIPRYPYGKGIDEYIQPWCKEQAFMSFEIVTKEDNIL